MTSTVTCIICTLYISRLIIIFRYPSVTVAITMLLAPKVTPKDIDVSNQLHSSIQDNVFVCSCRIRLGETTSQHIVFIDNM